MEIISGDELLSIVENGTYIENGSKDSCEGIKYDFILSSMALTVGGSGLPHEIDHTEGAVIKPGEIAFVMTKESLNLPSDIYCQLSTKRKLSLDGIVILGGLIIDPNYKGKLIFGLYNLSSRNYPLLPGKKLVAGVFYRVNKNTGIVPEPIGGFPDELVRIMVDTKPNSIGAVNTVINELREELREIKNQLTHDDKWKTDFQNGLTEIQQLVKKLSEKLDTEIETRQKDISDLGKDQVKLKEMLIPLVGDKEKYHFLLNVIVGIVAAVVAGIVVYFFTKQ